MINQITYFESKKWNPYRNLAIEELLLSRCREKECILYLWQNQHTVVIGRNQNAWRECRISRLESDKGCLARRKSGGGAVYHDLGNLNYSFLAKKENFDVEKQMAVIQQGLSNLGIAVEISGRNDILIDGKKFSGNAFFEQDAFCCHHGTLMLNVDVVRLSSYLSASKNKIESKGIRSVKSRVRNLKDIRPDLTIEHVKRELRSAFELIYGLESRLMNVEELDAQELSTREKAFSDWNWIYGRSIDFQHEFSKRFPWGELVLQFQIRAGNVKDVAAYSDALQIELSNQLIACLKDIQYTKEELCKALNRCSVHNEQESEMKRDIVRWISDMDF